MPIPIEVSYSTIGKSRKKQRNVIGIICPTALNQAMFKKPVIFVEMGDIECDWNESSAGLEYWFNNQ